MIGDNLSRLTTARLKVWVTLILVVVYLTAAILTKRLGVYSLVCAPVMIAWLIGSSMFDANGRWLGGKPTVKRVIQSKKDDLELVFRRNRFRRIRNRKYWVI